MKTELSHNKIALYKSEKLLSVIMITLFYVFRILFSPYMSSFSLPSKPYFHHLTNRYLVRSLQAINSSATTCGFWLSLMRASILRT